MNNDHEMVTKWNGQRVIPLTIDPVVLEQVRRLIINGNSTRNPLICIR